ncbi:hypothetical protein P7H50_14140 [Enterococcus durans]|uniref:hypothetical protein n=1 Tax=Enterococcus durans TaxID=53345 RepID=UPI00288D4FD4|nr:hypothetical protein [Enterococcus durans]MDT2837992.1 hypothetical protein [Enterococcus durans]
MDGTENNIIQIPNLKTSRAGFQIDTTDFDNLLKQEELSNDTKAIIQAQKYNFIALVDFSKNYDYWMSSYIYPFNQGYSNAINLIYNDHLSKLKEHFVSFDEFKTEYEREVLKSEESRTELLDKVASLDLNTEKISGENFSVLDQKIGSIQAQTYTDPEVQQIEIGFQTAGYIFIVFIIPLLLAGFSIYKIYQSILRSIF